MANMLDAINILYTQKDAINRQICLFSICGIIGLLNGILSLNQQNFIEINLIQKFLFAGLIILFGLFLVGYETIFLHSRELPDINMESFKIAFNKIPFIVFLLGVPLAIISVFTKYQYLAFCFDTILAIPLTMAQAGFSYHYNNDDFKLLFKKFTVKEYFLLLVKRLWVVISAYIITLFIIFILFFAVGIILAIIYKGDASSISFVISSQQTTIAKLSNFITAILLTYTLAIGTLVWDYELVKTNERED